ncbi:DEAD/DEAH box helicase [Pseudomonas aeruginosa]|uniref:DEAD/DEAH box helicase n=1 Tax=Pseudomonas aeruginosa TaxID=287 RepID=UPI0013CE2224|nr:DEAD/DEAH box helicase [Pseudomonas aeruginosa]HBO2745114.1 DEAD/DEAH box helicase [Pseudomonas aeruginosa]
MKLSFEISQDIWGNEMFHNDLAILESANQIIEHETYPLDISVFNWKDLLNRLLQSALVFADSGDEKFVGYAQKISTSALKFGQGYGIDVGEVFSIIQSRLRNFPALAVLEKDGLRLPRNAPLSIQFEFLNSLNDQTVRPEGGGEYVFSKFQLEAWNALRLKRSSTLSAPTSAGKSYVILLHLVERYRRSGSCSIVYLVPTRALINQVSADAQREFEKSNIREVTITTVPVDMSLGEAGKALYVFTQERLEALLINSPSLSIDLVVIDEAQMLSDGSRGILLESVVDKVLQSNPNAQFVFSGPMIENPGFFGEVFGIDSFESCATKQSPVTQNIISLKYGEKPNVAVDVYLAARDSQRFIQSVQIKHRLLSETDRISHISYLFGRSGSSIVYAGGKAEAEKVALKISGEVERHSEVAKNEHEDLSELIGFVKKHVHKNYALVNSLKNGVGFHYGHMPSLLRKELEDHFKARKIDYLVCTSTLLYGLNLPARNLFLLKPTTGRGSAISGTDFWNLAGRAGRLGSELEGNVYLIDYESWENRPLEEAKEVRVTSALKVNLVNHADELLGFLSEKDISSEKSPELEITLGKLILDHRQGRLQKTISRYVEFADPEKIQEIEQRISDISTSVELPTEILSRNISVSVFRQLDLLAYFERRLKVLDPVELIPAHPLVEFSSALSNYRRAFKRIHTYLLKYASGDKRHNFFAPLALRWMRGDPLPQLIDSSIRYHKKIGSRKNEAAIIRDTMEDVENDLRFRYVKFFGCYNSLLEYALTKADLKSYISLIPDVALFLEMGGSSGAMISLMALGLSRSTAESIADYAIDKDMSVVEAKAWLSDFDLVGLDISPICTREILVLRERLELLDGSVDL